MPIKSISTQKAGQVLDATHYLLLGNNPVTIYDIEGESTSAGAALYIQLLGTITPSSGNTVPLYSRLCVPAAATAGVNGFSFVYRPVGLDTSTMSYPESSVLGGSNNSPVVVAISSTDNVYTAVAASTHVTVDLEDTYLELGALTITGDTTTAVDNLTVYTTPNAAKELVQFQVTNNLGATAYLMLFAYSPANGALPLQQWQVGTGLTITERFGGGWPIMQNDGQPNASGIVPQGTNRTGCYLVGSSTTQVLTKTTGTNWTMKAWNL